MPARSRLPAVLAPLAALLAACGSDAPAPLWRPAPPMAGARSYHSATVLESGQVLVAGGLAACPDAACVFGWDTASAELYDAARGSWEAANRMGWARASIRAVLLPATAGRPAAQVLVGSGHPELYDEATGRWRSTGVMNHPRGLHVAVYLPQSGKVLVAGGVAGAAIGTAELYDPATGAWSDAAPMGAARAEATGTLLASGKVLVAGGYYGSLSLYWDVEAYAELYDPETASWSRTAAMVLPRFGHAAVRLASGKVLVVGGAGGASAIGPGRAAELYDPETASWTATASTAVGHNWPTATLLASGRVLVTGGADSPQAELYDPATGTWSSAGAMSTPRYGHAAVLLPTGEVLVTGGISGPLIHASAEIFHGE